MLFHDLEMVHAAIYDNCSAIVHQEPLIIEVIFKGWMLNRADMVGADIEKDTDIKGQAIDPFLEISLTGNFHDEMCPIISKGLGHHFNKIQTLWCGQS